MTLGEAKRQLLLLLDESKPKAELTDKLPRLLDMGQKEVALYYPVYKTAQYGAADPRALPADFFRGAQITADGVTRAFDPGAALPEGAFTLRYEARPGDIPDNAPDDTPLALADEAVGAAVLFAAAQANSMEYDQRFFQSFYAQYQGKLVNLTAMLPGPAAVAEVDEDVWL